MRIFRAELKKLLACPVGRFLLLLALALLVIVPAKDVYRYRTVNEEASGLSVEDIIREVNTRTPPDVKTYLNRKWDGALDDPALHGKVDEAAQEYLYTWYGHWDNVFKLRLYRNSGMLADEDIEGPMDEKIFEKVSIRKARIKQGMLEVWGQKDCPEYAALDLQIDMMNEVGIQSGGYVTFWNRMETRTQLFGVLFTAMYILLISRVFAMEYTSGMYMLLASTREGKRKTAWAKLGACFVTGVGIVLLINLVPAAIYLLGGSAVGWDEKLNNLDLFPYCPYNLTVWQYFLLKILFQLLAVLAMGAVTAFLSLKLRSTIPAAAAGLVVLLYPYGLNLLGGGQESLLTLFSLGYGVNPVKVFDRFHILTPFGEPVLYPPLMAIFLILAVVLFIFLTCRSYGRGKCNMVR